MNPLPFPGDPMTDYETKKAARIDRMRDRAETLRNESVQREASARRLADIIPMGQPILVGHHSEKRHRRDLKRINGGFEKAWELGKEAADLERRASAAESNRMVSSDDPDAITKLEEKLAKLETDRATWKQINVACRTKDPIAALGALGFGEATAADLMQPDQLGRIGIPDYRITNSGAEVRRLKSRIEKLRTDAVAPAKEPETIGEVTIREEENRVRIFFPGKPSAEKRAELKRSGFRWCPTAGAWQRYASPQAWYLARLAILEHQSTAEKGLTS